MRQHQLAKWLGPTVAGRGRQRLGAVTTHPKTVISPRNSRLIRGTPGCCAKDAPKPDFESRGLADFQQLLAPSVRTSPGGADSGRGWGEETNRLRLRAREA